MLKLTMKLDLDDKEVALIKTFLNFHEGVNYKAKVLKSIRKIQNALESSYNLSASEMLLCISFLDQGVKVLDGQEKFDIKTEEFKENVRKLTQKLQNSVDQSSGRKRNLLYSK